MPTGIQFGNLNKYRRYPFADDVDTRCTVHVTPGNDDHVVDFPVDFLRSFRVVHVGVKPVGSVYLSSVYYHRQARPRLRRTWTLGFEFVMDDGSPLPFFCQGVPFYPDDNIVKLPDCVSSSIAANPNLLLTRVATISDFDFSNYISICTKFDPMSFTSSIENQIGYGYSTTSLLASCRLKMAPATVVSMKTPHVMSVLDDVGEAIKDKDEIGMVAGYNVKFDVVPGTNALLVSAVVGTGAGEAYCESGLSTMFSGATVKKINGVSASPTGNVQLAGGSGIAVQPVSGTNIINIYSTSEDKDSMECKMS